METALVHLAIALANGEMMGYSNEEALEGVSCSVWNLTQLGRTDVDAVMDELHGGMAEISDLILSPVSTRSH
jgi:hypothetical protein